MPQSRSGFFGKYSALLIAIGSFFLLSTSIFSVNYLLSSRLAEDGASINDSGRMRGLTQQHAKAILSLSNEVAAAAMIQTSQAQISESQLGLDEALARLRAGAEQAKDATQRELLDKFEKHWRPLADASKTLVGKDEVNPDEMQYALAKSNSNNVRLMQVADDITQHLEAVGTRHASELSTIQTGAIVVASLNFLFIVFYALRSLRRSDRIAEAARREMERILNTVREGLFLIDAGGTVGSQRSGLLEKVFPRPLPPGANFLHELESLVSAATLDSAKEYIGLLFNKRVKASLLQSLNPLQRVEIRGERMATYLSFEFHPVIEEGGGIAALLVSAVDITQQVRLERELQQADERAQTEMSLLIGVLENDPAVVGDFLSGAVERLDAINDELRDVRPGAGNYAALVGRIFRVAHTIKGEAAMLALDTVMQRTHAFEEALSVLRGRADLAGEDLIPVAAGVADVLEELSKVKRIVDKVGAYAGGRQGDAALADEDVHGTFQRIQRLALAVAADLNKRLRVETSLAHIDDVPHSVLRVMKEGLPQLVRNAVAHGIETASERVSMGKQAEGAIRIELRRGEGGGLELEVADDGRGIDVRKLREDIAASGRRSERDVMAMSDREVVAMIFEPGFSTTKVADAHSGRGVGLDVLLALARETGARLRVASVPQGFTRFTLQWSPAT